MNNDDVPLWWKIINLEDSAFERSRYAGNSFDGKGKFRLKDISVLRRMAPGIYESAAGEVKADSEALCASKGNIRKYKLGRKLGSIPIIDAALHPELANDPKAQDKYWQDNPEMRCRES